MSRLSVPLLLVAISGGVRADDEVTAPGQGRARLTEIQALMDGHTSRGNEARILVLLSEAPADELSWLLLQLCLSDLFCDVDDRALGPDNRTALEKLLARRSGELSLPARAALIDTLQSGETDSGHEELICALLLAARGSELTTLKDLIDAGNDHRSLFQLVHSDLDDEARRKKLLDHFLAQAVPVDAVKVWSDIDDTIYANWKDTRFPGKTVYPGVRALYEELDRGPAVQPGRLGDLVFVTARPWEPTGKVADEALDGLKKKGLGDAIVLSGSFSSLLSSEAIAAEKLKNCRGYQALFPEYRYVWLGDSGQGDAILGRKLKAELGERVVCCLIHDVIGLDLEERTRWTDSGVYMHDTYVGAAILAFQHLLIRPEGLARVAREAREELGKIAFESREQARARSGELERDVVRANRILPEALRLPEVH